jgi:hypothetical protein
MTYLAAIALLIVFGPGLLTYVDFLIRRSRWRESVPLLEAAIDRVAGIGPPSRNRIDHFFTLFQLVMMTLTGLIVTGLGIFVIVADSGILE